jgi:hypothetical protein
MASNDRYRAVVTYLTDYEQEGDWVEKTYVVGPYRTVNAVKGRLTAERKHYPFIYYGSPSRARQEAKITSIRFECARLVWEEIDNI